MKCPLLALLFSIPLRYVCSILSDLLFCQVSVLSGLLFCQVAYFVSYFVRSLFCQVSFLEVRVPYSMRLINCLTQRGGPLIYLAEILHYRCPFELMPRTLRFSYKYMHPITLARY